MTSLTREGKSGTSRLTRASHVTKCSHKLSDAPLYPRGDSIIRQCPQHPSFLPTSHKPVFDIPIMLVLSTSTLVWCSCGPSPFHNPCRILVHSVRNLRLCCRLKCIQPLTMLHSLG